MMKCVSWAWAVAVLLLVAQSGRSSESSPPAPFPPRVALSAGAEEFIGTEERVASYGMCLVAGNAGDAWLFMRGTSSVPYAARRNGTWSKLAPIPADGWRFINQMAAAADKGGRPVVVWAGLDDAHGEAIAFTRWSGEAWSTPVILDRLEVSTSVSSLHMLRDPAGRVHLVCDRPLVPRESYNNFGHGYFPSKAWHAVFDDEKWSKPTPTTGPGWFGVEPQALSIGPAGGIVLGVHVSLPSGPGYLGQQVWDGSKWGNTEKLWNASLGRVVATPWGDRLVWWCTGDLSRGAFVLRGKREAPIPEGCRSGLATSDKAGRIFVCGREVCVWNGESWSGGLKLGDVDVVVATPDGNLLAAVSERKGVRIREVLVREAAAASQPATANDPFSDVRSPEPPDLHRAIRRKDAARVKEILAANSTLALSRDDEGNTALIAATQRGDTAVVEMLLNAGDKPDRDDHMGTRPLHLAARNGHVDIARLLLDHGATVNEEDRRGKTAFAYAQQGGNAQLVKLLKDRGGTVKDFGKQLIVAVRSGDQEAVTKLLDQGLSAMTAVPNGQCLLDFAAEANDVPMARLLIARGASIKRAGNSKRTALHWASWEGKADMVAFLVEQGADPNAKDADGDTPLHKAVEAAGQHPDEALAAIRSLIAGSADVNAKDDEGVTPLGRAKKHGTDAVRECLRKNGAVE